MANVCALKSHQKKKYLNLSREISFSFLKTSKKKHIKKTYKVFK